jgi:hypothetical protein
MQLPAQCRLQRKDTFFGSKLLFVPSLVELAMEGIEHLLIRVCIPNFRKYQSFKLLHELGK